MQKPPKEKDQKEIIEPEDPLIDEEDLQTDLEKLEEQLTEVQEKINDKPKFFQKEENKNEKEFAKTMLEAGYRGETLITDKEGFKKITTDKRLEILSKLKEEQIESVQDLADKLNRDRANLSRDLDTLFKEDMINYEREGKKKKPKLKHSRIAIRPLEI